MRISFNDMKTENSGKKRERGFVVFVQLKVDELSDFALN